MRVEGLLGAIFVMKWSNSQTTSSGKESSGKISVLDADTLHLPFQDNYFQVSAVAFGIRNVSDLRAGIIEMMRITA